MRIPADAFDAYFSLGPDRSYQALAKKYGVSKKGITLMAKRERWQQRMRELEAKARETSDRKKQESLEEEAERRLKVLRFLEGKAIEALRSTPISSVADAIRALDVVFRNRRPVRGENEPVETRPIVNVLQVTAADLERRKRWLNAATLLQHDPGSFNNPQLLEVLRETEPI